MKFLSDIDGIAASFTGAVTVGDEAYGIAWDGSFQVPTKNALYDKIESLASFSVIDGFLSTSTTDAGSANNDRLLDIKTDRNEFLGTGVSGIFMSRAIANMEDLSSLGVGNTLVFLENTTDAKNYLVFYDSTSPTQSDIDINFLYLRAIRSNTSIYDERIVARTAGNAKVCDISGSYTYVELVDFQNGGPVVNNATLRISYFRENISVAALLSGGTFTGDISVPDEAYSAAWNGSLEVPTKNALYDKFESFSTNFVDLTTNQNIGGVKTFTDSPIIETSGNSLLSFKNSTVAGYGPLLGYGTIYFKDNIFRIATTTGVSSNTSNFGFDVGALTLTKDLVVTNDDITYNGTSLLTDGSGTAVWGGITGTLSNQTDLQSALDLKANDNEVVKLTGNQTVDGLKEFKQAILINSNTASYSSLFLKLATGDITSNGATAGYGGMYFNNDGTFRLQKASSATNLGFNFNALTGVAKDLIFTDTDITWNGTSLLTDGSGTAVWGGITGTLSNQTDLQSELDAKANLTGATFTGDILVPDEVYGVGWDASLEVPTKNAVYDKFESFSTNFVDLTTNQSIGGLKTFTQDLAVSVVGSSYTTPRVLGMTGFASGLAGRFQFGDQYNAIQSGNGRGMDMYSYNSIKIRGSAGRDGATNKSVSLVDTSFHVPIDGVAVQLETSWPNNAIRVKGVASQVANLFEVVNELDTKLVQVLPDGRVKGSDPVDAQDFVTKTFADVNYTGGAVDSVFGRTGAVVAQVGDYSAFYLGIGATAVNSDGLGGKVLTASGNRFDVIPFVATDGVMEVGKFIDFHGTDADTTDFLTRIEADAANSLKLTGNFTATGTGSFGGATLTHDNGTVYGQIEQLREVGGNNFKAAMAVAGGTGYSIFTNNDVTGGVTKYYEVGGADPRYYDGSVLHKIWHEGNDGAGSGLDADLLDGINSTQFLRIENTTANDGFTVLNRNQVTNPVLYVNQYGTGDIAKFYKGVNVGDTSGASEIIFTNSGGITATGTIATGLTTIKDGYPQIHLEQTGSAASANFGTGTGYSVFDAIGHTTNILQLRNAGAARFTFDLNGNFTATGQGNFNTLFSTNDITRGFDDASTSGVILKTISSNPIVEFQRWGGVTNQFRGTRIIKSLDDIVIENATLNPTATQTFTERFRFSEGGNFTATGSITSNSGLITAFNPNNINASVALSWVSDIPRLRVGGTGAGASSAFDIQGTGDFLRARFETNGDFRAYGAGFFANAATIDAGTTGDAILYIRSDTDNNDESDHPSIRLQQDAGLVDMRIGLGISDDDSGTENNSLVLGNVLAGGDQSTFYWKPFGDTIKKVWHEGNDGAGSGLDADLLDGLNSSDFARLNARSDGYVWVRRNSTGNAALYITQQAASGNIVDFRQGAGDGSTVASIGNAGNITSTSTIVSTGNEMRVEGSSPRLRFVESGFANQWTFIQDSNNITLRENNTSNTRLTIAAGGNATFTGDVTANSDIRLKENIKPIKNALAKVNTLKGCTWTRKDNGATQTGLIAQDLKKVLPEAVGQDNSKEKLLSIAYGNTVGLLVEALKEIHIEVEELRKEIKTLKNAI